MDDWKIMRLVPQSQVERLREHVTMIKETSSSNSNFTKGEAAGIEIALALMGLDASQERENSTPLPQQAEKDINKENAESGKRISDLEDAVLWLAEAMRYGKSVGSLPEFFKKAVNKMSRP